MATPTTATATPNNSDGFKRRRVVDQRNSTPRNYISQLILEMEDALWKLVDDDDNDIERRRDRLTIPKLEEMAILIYESMSICSRNYHSVQHIFDICQELDDPIAILAACFHDCIYYHVDGGLTRVQTRLLEGTYCPADVERPNPSLVCNNQPSSCNDKPSSEYHHLRTGYTFRATSFTNLDKDRNILLLQLVESIFGYQPDETIDIRNGLNEFLSAVIAVRQLQDLLPIHVLAQIACCIEATIPFRSVDAVTGKSHMERLYERMQSTADRFQLHELLVVAKNQDGVGDGGENENDPLVVSVQRACIMSNSDVGNFGTTDRLWFLDNTWSLLPESNESLRNQFVYSVRQFHDAMRKMYGFFGFLQPEVVFHSFRNVPSQEEMDRLTGECRRNLLFGKTYVGAKLLAMSLVASLAVLTGGDDAPLSLFTGDLTGDHHQQNHVATAAGSTGLESLATTRHSARRASLIRLESYHILPDPPANTMLRCTKPVYEILAMGRRSKTSFDTRKSPWAAFLYGSLGDDGLFEILNRDKGADGPLLYPMTPERARKLLDALPIEAVKVIAYDMELAALSRADAIRRIVAEVGEAKTTSDPRGAAET